jgi:hypothetical protein
VKLVAILAAIKGWFSNGGAGNTVGNTVANGGAVIAVIAALAPAVIWIVEHKDETFLTLTISYGWFSVGCLGLLAYIKVVHYTRPGRPDDRGQS